MADQPAFNTSNQKRAFPDDAKATEGMSDQERASYGSMRGKGYLPDESRYHSTNPPGRLYPPSAPDPWDEKDS